MRIISPGTLKHTFKCPKCRCVFVCDNPNEFDVYFVQDKPSRMTATCPSCKSIVSQECEFKVDRSGG